MEEWVWITWERHRRTRELCRALEIRLFEKNYCSSRLLKHPYLIFWTFLVVLKTKPKGLIVQNPSIVLALWSVVLKAIFKFALVVDTHNGGLGLAKEGLGCPQFVYRHIQRKADLTIITNTYLGELVKNNGGQPFVLEDNIPQFHNVRKVTLLGKHNIVCICTFSGDEPFLEVIAATSALEKDWVVYMTGNSKKLPPDVLQTVPRNLVLTGFLKDEEYLGLIKSADVVVDLTYRDHCLVCGAYEAVALEKPMILSDWGVLRSYFSKGVIYTRNEPHAIKEAIQTAIGERINLHLGVRALKAELLAQWEYKKHQLVVMLNSLTT